MKTFKQARWLAFVVILAVAVAAVPFLDAPKSASYAASSRLKAPQNVKAVSTDAHAIRISWKKVKRAKGYMLYRYDSRSKKYQVIKTVSAQKRKWTNQGLTTDKVYKYKVRGYNIVKGKKKLGKLSYRVSAKPQTKDSKVKNVRRVDMDGACGEIYPGYRGQIWATPMAGSYMDDVRTVSQKLVWSSSNSKVLKAGRNGTFQALKTGTAYIIARAHNGVQARYKIRVRGYSAYINGKKISLGEKLLSLNKKFGKPRYGNLNDSIYGEILSEFGGIDKRIKLYVYGTSTGELTVLGINGSVEAYASKDAASFNLQGIRNGDSGSASIKKKLKQLWSYVEYIDLEEWGQGSGYYYMGFNDDETTNALVDVTGGTVCGIAVGGEEFSADLVYNLMQ